MKFILLLSVVICCYAITCPNMCSGHGSCNNGVCLCSFGFAGGDCSSRLCPRDVPYTDPNGKLGEGERTFLECSGQGKCDRVKGECECFDGYEGNACQRQKCPNDCNNHGVCTPVNLLKLEDRVLEDAYYDNGYWKEGASNSWEVKDYKYWDKDHSFQCVCDKEWTGYDCSQRKCPTGYVSVSDCDSEPQTTQVFEFTTSNTGYGYIEYTDQLGRKWYTDRVEIKSKSGSVDSADATAIESALRALPPGVIDLDSVTADSTAKTITIKFGKHQTGKQTPMRIIGQEAFGNDKEFGEQTKAPGYHGMFADGDGATLSATTIEAKVESGIAPLVCGGNGKCLTETGICDCFDNYYGLACTLQKELI